MIVFDLVCFCGYRFEGWFNGSADFEAQTKSGLLICPQCGSVDIRKVLSPVAVRTGVGVKESPPPDSQSKTADGSTYQALRILQNYVERHFEDVGPKLAEKALKMHYGMEESRNIRGVASREEEKILKNEGITLLSIPMLKKNDESDPN